MKIKLNEVFKNVKKSTKKAKDKVQEGYENITINNTKEKIKDKIKDRYTTVTIDPKNSKKKGKKATSIKPNYGQIASDASHVGSAGYIASDMLGSDDDDIDSIVKKIEQKIDNGESITNSERKLMKLLKDY